LEAHRGWIAGEVLATRIEWRDGTERNDQAMTTADLDGITARMAITKAA
jgi:hypothetical protein